MDRRGRVNLEVKKGDNLYIFSMPLYAPHGEAYDAAYEALKEIKKMSDEAIKKAERVIAKEAKAGAFETATGTAFMAEEKISK